MNKVGVGDKGTFILMTAGGSVELLNTMLGQRSSISELPSEIFAAEPRLSEGLIDNELETQHIPITSSRTHTRARRDNVIAHILELADENSGVAAMPNIGQYLTDVTDLYVSQWMGVSQALVAANCITTVKPQLKSKMVGIIVHPGHIEAAVQTGKLSVPSKENLRTLAKIDQVSRELSVQAVAAALGLE